MADEEIKADTLALKRFAQAIRECPQDLFAELQPAGERFLRSWIGKGIKAARFGPGGDVIHPRTGSLRRAFDSTSTGSSIGNLRFSAGTIRQGLPYAWIQEYGGDIVPKRAKWLTVPLPPAKTAAGVPRFSPREALSQPGVRFFKNPKTGKLFIVRETKTRFEFLFRLVKRVHVAGKLGFHASWKRNEPGFIGFLEKAVERALARNAKREGGS